MLVLNLLFNAVILGFVTALQMVAGLGLGLVIYLVYGLDGKPFAWLVLVCGLLLALGLEASLEAFFRWGVRNAFQEEDRVWMRVASMPSFGRLLVFGPFVLTLPLSVVVIYQSVHATAVPWGWLGLYLVPVLTLIGWIRVLARPVPQSAH